MKCYGCLRYKRDRCGWFGPPLRNGYSMQTHSANCNGPYFQTRLMGFVVVTCCLLALAALFPFWAWFKLTENDT